MEPNKKLIQTYVFTDDGAFFVSTIDRNCSSMMGGRYAETLVFQWDAEKRERGHILFQGEAMEGSIRRHVQIVESLFALGLEAFEEKNDE